MKTLPSVVFLTLLLPLITFSQSNSTISPLLGGYVIANSAEAVYLATPQGSTKTVPWIWDYSPGATPFSGAAPASTDTLAGTSIDVATGDFNADGQEEVVTAWRNALGQLCIGTRNALNVGGTSWGWNNAHTFVFATDTVRTTVRVVQGNFDRDDADDFLVAYWGNSGAISVSVFTLDAGLVPIRIASKADVSMATSLSSMGQFDIAAGDFDNDRIDEIVLSRTVANAAAREPVNIRLKLYDFDPASSTIIGGADTLIALRTFGGFAECWRNKFALSAGDYDNDGLDECVMIYQEGFWKTLLVLQEVDLKVLPFAPSPTLTSFNLATAGAFVSRSWESSQEPSFVPAGGASVVSADVDGDGYAELAVAGLDRVKLWKSTAWPAFTFCGESVFNTTRSGPSHGLIAVADVDGDTVQASWKSEIVVADYVTSSWVNTSTGNARVRLFTLAIDTTKFPYGITGLTQVSEQLIATSSGSTFAVAAGDFDGDAVRVRGPRLITAESFVQPLVILNVPPTHYDVLGNVVYDVCKSYPGNTTFKATYVKTSSSTQEFSSQQTNDWTLSANIGAKLGSMLGLNFSAKYGENFSKKTGSSNTISISDETHTSGDDYIFASLSTYNFWEYPLFIKGVSAGNALVVFPSLNTLEWLPRKDPRVFRHDQSHEVGNILSYMKVPSLLGAFDINSIVCNSFQGYTVSDKAGKTWEVSLDASQETTTEWSKSVELGFGASLSAWGIDVGVSGTYSNKSVETHVSKATRGVKITLEVGSPDPSLGTADYSITPLLYWSTNGALTIDYAVEPTVWSYPDTSLRTWWQRKYGLLSDPAFILPWRLDAQKTGDSTMTRVQKLLSKSIRVSPATANPGDTVLISVRVHNFSLMDTPSQVKVRLFVGDPDSGGVAIVGLGGMTELTSGPIAARDYVNLLMQWVVTGPGLAPSTRIHAVIDPENLLSEIHKDNNKGWTILSVPNATGIRESTGRKSPERITLYQNYPNPFNPATVIRFSLPQRTHVVLTMYDILGRQVRVLVNEVKEAGSHNVWFDGAPYASGVYFYRIQAGSFVDTRRSLLLK